VAVFFQLTLPLCLFLYFFIYWFEYTVRYIELMNDWDNYSKSEYVVKNKKFEASVVRKMVMYAILAPIVCLLLSALLTVVAYVPVFFMMIFYWFRLMYWRCRSNYSEKYTKEQIKRHKSAIDGLKGKNARLKEIRYKKFKKL
jgi:hypothetical protein